MSRFRSSAATHIGQVRWINEDRILSMPEHSLWVVADGMGGHAAGDFASQTMVHNVAKMPMRDGLAEQGRELQKAILDAHEIVRDEAGMRNVGTIGAAVVALVASDSDFICFWAGDCRLYLLRGDEIQLLTADHSVVADLVKLGQLSWDEAESHPQSNVITRAVGVGDVLDLDFVRGSIQDGDRLLLCSDGLNKYADLDLLRQTLIGSPIESVADRLIQIALASGGSDNISVIVIDVT